METEKNNEKKEKVIRGEWILLTLCALWGVAGYKIGANRTYNKCINGLGTAFDAKPELAGEMLEAYYRGKRK